MRLVDKWQRVLLHSHSMRAQFLGLIALWVPEILFALIGYDAVAPQVWFALGQVLILYGMIGRMVKQPKVSG
ncbi:hypothetical protein [Pararhodobacter sp. CCB-MM2]|uniref:DUF7940 domain-containing protein n=1 Tax=Pararhodobacter sp. CCB-MM2 TaxID=1786003 RepID=UPI0008333453|nr:hypothetical protein [Pararhodobacter sp. CCB-MM2]